MKSLFTVFFILTSCQIGNSLICYKCDESGHTCANLSVTNCYSGEACGQVTYQNYVLKDCVPTIICGASIEGIKTHCCYSDLCNSAVSARMSFKILLTILVIWWIIKE
ncbi:Hypothetical predicted protein [Pelobates cultripes]|uniref:Uncharacterized protein n=1 Tax=Pelobates cultripes TaxID=61616 RepID=A0AAD1T3F0_PELCU|nr:Hypothetical predicted protein [Pelobates cultripes]